MPSNARTLRNVRLEKGLTQANVADKMGVSQSLYSTIERGLNRPAFPEAMEVVAKMRSRTTRTPGGTEKVGRLK